ncbi:MAG: hypothetical protein IT539_06500 [Bradyrhizobiaceae bacterium]|nr:hypothetical protein [Bradyrhizobiaceae bacterium]
MRISVKTQPAGQDAEQLHSLRLDGRQVEIAETADQWAGADYRYFKVRDADGNIYIVRHDEPRNEWELTMFERAHAPADASERDLHRLLH